MSDDRKLLRDVVRFRGQRDDAREALVRVSRVLDEYRAEAIAVRVRGRLLRLEDLDRFIGVENVLDADGRIDDGELELRLTNLLNRRPELAAPAPIVGGQE